MPPKRDASPKKGGKEGGKGKGDDAQSGEWKENVQFLVDTLQSRC